MQVSYGRCVLTAGTDTINNGINQFILVLKRANYIVPSRANRSFPLLPGLAEPWSQLRRATRGGIQRC